jgi:hypothetical protein
VILIKQKNAQGKLEKTDTLLFGPDGTGDGKRHLYVSNEWRRSRKFFYIED